MKTAKEIMGKVLHSETRTLTNTSPPKSAALPESWVAAIFKRFGLAYGNLWTSQCPTQKRTDEMIAEWGRVLADVKPEQIKRGLDALPDMPPTLPQFKRLCVGHFDDWQHNTAAYKPFQRQLPKPPAKAETVQSALAAMRSPRKMDAAEIEAELRRLKSV